MRRCLVIIASVFALGACESTNRIPAGAVQETIDAEMRRAAQGREAPAQPEAVSQALLPPLTVEMPGPVKPLEPRFDLAVNNAPAHQIFMALVSGTRYSMLVHPDIKEPISINLKDVTLTEALEAIREIYGYEYKIQGTRIYIEPRLIFFVNTNESRPLFLSYTFTTQKRAQFRDNFYGREQRHELALNARFLGNTRVEFRGTLIREFLMDHTPFQVRRLFLTRVARQFTPKLRTRILGQVSNDRRGQDFNVNSIVAYDFTARSALILGYNYQRRAPGRPGDLGNEFFVKFSYLFQF